MLHFLLILPLFFSAPDLKVSLRADKQASLDVRVEGRNDTVLECLKSGLEVRYRYEFQLCRRRTGWFPTCSASRLAFHAVQLDPITESYKIARDRHGDDEPEEVLNVDSEGLAWEKVSNLEDVSLEFLGRGDEDYLRGKKRYVSVRALAECRGEYSELLANIGYFITFGLVKVSAFSTGWIDFELS